MNLRTSIRTALNILIVVAILLSPCVHAQTCDEGANASHNVSMSLGDHDPSPERGVASPHCPHCCFEHSQFVASEVSESDISKRAQGHLAENDATKASTVVAPPLKPPSI